MKLKLHYPLKPIIITQGFADKSLVSYYTKNGVDMRSGHNGLDLAAHHGQPIYASHDGIATFEIDSKNGRFISLWTTEFYEYKGGLAMFKTIYGHLCDSTREPQYKGPVEDFPNGVFVKAGTLIAYADNTGLSNGDHTHFGLKPLNADGTNIEQNNGFNGAIDPTPYWIDEYAQDIGKPVIEHFSKDLKRGDESDDVLRLQKLLHQFNYLSKADLIGIYGPRTQRAVFRFQQDFGVPLTIMDRYYEGKYFGPKSRKVANRLYPS